MIPEKNVLPDSEIYITELNLYLSRSIIEIDPVLRLLLYFHYSRSTLRTFDKKFPTLYSGFGQI